MKNLVSTDWLEKNLENVRILDGSWHLPVSNRNALNEFELAHIKNSNFFDIDKYSNQESNLPHMLPKKDHWEESGNPHDHIFHTYNNIKNYLIGRRDEIRNTNRSNS